MQSPYRAEFTVWRSSMLVRRVGIKMYRESCRFSMIALAVTKQKGHTQTVICWAVSDESLALDI